MENLFAVVGHEASGQCIACDKTDKECMVIDTGKYVAPHCAACAMREARKCAMGLKQAAREE